MKKYNINGHLFNLRTTPEEITTGELIAISSFKEVYKPVTAYMKIFEHLGMPMEVLNIIDTVTLMSIVSDFNSDFTMDGGELARTVEVNGRRYYAYTEDTTFNLKSRDFSKIEEYLEHKEVWFLYALAVIFKDEELTNNEHYDDAHIKHKSELFKTLPTSITLPYLTYLTELYVEHLKAIE